MAGVTATITALAGAGLSAAQMVDGKKRARNAMQAAKVAMNEYANVKETNKMEALKAPDVSSLQFQENAAQVQQAVTGLQEMGPEGAAGVAGVVEQGRRANLQTAQAQGEMNYARDAAVLGTEQEIEKRNTDARRNVLSQEIAGAQSAADAANTQFMTGAKGLASSLGMGIGALGEATGLTEGAYLGGGAEGSMLTEADLNPEELGLWRDAQNRGESWEKFVRNLRKQNG